MLRYDTVKDNIWHGYLMICTTDEGSEYDPIAPNALLEWDATMSSFVHNQAAEESDESVNRRHINAIRIYTYHSIAGPQSFWRFKLEVPLGEREEEIFYSINVSNPAGVATACVLTQFYVCREAPRTLSGFPLTARTCDVSSLFSSRLCTVLTHHSMCRGRPLVQWFLRWCRHCRFQRVSVTRVCCCSRR